MNKLKYELIGSNDINNVKRTILENRGVEDIEKYLSLNESVLHSYELLDNVHKGVELLKTAIENKRHIYIIVD